METGVLGVLNHRSAVAWACLAALVVRGAINGSDLANDMGSQHRDEGH